MDLLDLLNSPIGGHSGNQRSNNNNSSSSSSSSRNINQLLFLYSSRGNITKFKELYQQQEQQREQQEQQENDKINLYLLHNGLNCLHTSIKKNHIEIVKYILDIDYKLLYSLTNDNRTCLMIASYEGNLEILQLLVLYYKKLLNTTTTTTITITNDDNNVKDLLNETDKLGNTFLHYASWGGHLNCIKYCLEECSMNPLQKNKEGMDSLQFCSAGNHIDCLKYVEEYIATNTSTTSSIIEKYSQISLATSETETGLTPFHRACLHGAIDIVTHIIEQIEAQNKIKYSKYLSENNTLTISNEELKLIQEVYFTTGIYHRSHNGNTSLHLATQNNSINILRKLIEYIQREAQQFPFLYQDYENSNNNVVSLSKGIDIQNQYGLTPLHFSCIGGYTDIFKLLRSVKASLLTYTSSQSLCLHLAATSGSRPICDSICEDMIEDETISRLKLLHQQQQVLKNEDIHSNLSSISISNSILNIQRKDSILETQDQDGMTCIDMALSSGYKALASRLAQWTYTDARTMRVLGLIAPLESTLPTNTSSPIPSSG